MSESMMPSEQPERPVEPRRRDPAWVAGAILILIGLVFLWRNLTGFRLDNWWAIFILIPAISSLAAAWRVYQANERLTPAVRGPLTGGLILLLVVAVFLFNLDWGKIWPAFLIIAGVGGLLVGLAR